MKDTACCCTNVSRSRVFIEVDCGSPSRPVNGYIQGALFTAGKEVFYGCIEGYRLVGQDRTVCLASGKWSPYETPRCHCKSNTLTAKRSVAQWWPVVATLLCTSSPVPPDGARIPAPFLCIHLNNDCDDDSTCGHWNTYSIWGIEAGVRHVYCNDTHIRVWDVLSYQILP